MLEEARNIARLKLADILLRGTHDPTGTCLHRCGWSSKHAYVYLKTLDEQDLWPVGLSTRSLFDAINTVGSIPDPVPQERSGSCTYDYKHRTPAYRMERQLAMDNLDANLGLCLLCIKSEKNHTGHCRLRSPLI